VGCGAAVVEVPPWVEPAEIRQPRSYGFGRLNRRYERRGLDTLNRWYGDDAR
jgi:hypothetical protein